MSEAAEAVLGRFDVSRESAAALRAYVDLLLRWNRRINLIGRSDEAEVWRRHVADGLQLLQHLRPSDRVLVDLGSGAGIPGLVVALATRQPLEVHLVESTGKKAAFLREAVRLTGAPAIVHQERIEELFGRDPALAADVVTARALAPLPGLLALAWPLLSRGARGLFHKGRGAANELTDSAKCWRIKSRTYPSAVGEDGCIVEILEIAHV